MDPNRPVDNSRVRTAVEAFAADPNQRTSLDVLRACLLDGELLMDITGSQVQTTPEGQLAPGSSLAFAGGAGPDGRGALFAFTSAREIARMHPDGTQVQSLGQPATGALEQAVGDEHTGWLYIDPAGPTCALARSEIEFALGFARNDAVRTALEPDTPREQLIAALRADGPLLMGLDAGADPDRPQPRLVRAPDGGTALIVATSSIEVVAAHPHDGVVVTSSGEVAEQVRARGWSGLLINPAGPWAFVPVAELGPT
ncbi:MAG TPA: SseB family protein [Jatrophihabitans sp.]